MGKSKSEDQPQRTGQLAWTVLEAALERAFKANAEEISAVQLAYDEVVPEEQRSNVQIVLESDSTPSKSYRVGMVIQLAYAISAASGLDLTRRHPGARGSNGVAGRCGKYLKDRHVVASVDAYQNIAKNADTLTRGNFVEFDSFLKWASEPSRSKDQLRTILNYACLHIASTARPVKPLPNIDVAKLSFVVVTELFEDMLKSQSGGAHEQFIVAALLYARVEQEGGGQFVETKRLNASDLSSGTAGDVQLKTGTKIDEAFEVTANDWTEKLQGAGQTIRAHDLSRLHILARVNDFSGMLNELKARHEDISAIDLRAFLTVFNRGIEETVSRFSAPSSLRFTRSVST